MLGSWSFSTQTLRGIDVAEDRFIPLTSRESKGVRVLVELY